MLKKIKIDQALAVDEVRHDHCIVCEFHGHYHDQYPDFFAGLINE